MLAKVRYFLSITKFGCLQVTIFFSNTRYFASICPSKASISFRAGMTILTGLMFKTRHWTRHKTRPFWNACSPEFKLSLYISSILETKGVGTQFSPQHSYETGLWLINLLWSIAYLHISLKEDWCNSVSLRWQNPVLSRSWLITHTENLTPVLMLMTRSIPCVCKPI